MNTNTIAARSRRLTTTVTATLALVLTAMLGFAMSAAPAHAGAWDYLLPAPGVCGAAESNAGAPRADQTRAGLCLANAIRQNYGRSRLYFPHPNGLGNGALFLAAGFKARDIMSCQSGDPHYACGRPWDYWVKRYGYHNPGAGSCPNGVVVENWTRGSGHPLNTVREALKRWVNSDKGHRDNLLNPSFTQQGLTYSAYGMGTYNGFANTMVWVHYLCR